MEMSGIYEEGSLILTCNRIRTSKRFLNCNGFSRTPPIPTKIDPVAGRPDQGKPSGPALELAARGMPPVGRVPRHNLRSQSARFDPNSSPTSGTATTFGTTDPGRWPPAFCRRMQLGRGKPILKIRIRGRKQRFIVGREACAAVRNSRETRRKPRVPRTQPPPQKSSPRIATV